MIEHDDAMPRVRLETMRGERPGMTTHHVERLFVYPMTVLFTLIADIESYPLYMPGWRAVRINQRSPQRLEVEQRVSLFGLSVDFRSIAALDPPHQLRISATQFPFRTFQLCWQLRSLCPTSTIVQADFDLSFRTAPLNRFADKMAPLMLERTINAFAQRAKRIIIAQPSAQPGPAGSAPDHGQSARLKPVRDQNRHGLENPGGCDRD